MRFWILGFRVFRARFQIFKKVFRARFQIQTWLSELDFQKFDAKIVKIASKSLNVSSKSQTFAKIRFSAVIMTFWLSIPWIADLCKHGNWHHIQKVPLRYFTPTIIFLTTFYGAATADHDPWRAYKILIGAAGLQMGADFMWHQQKFMPNWFLQYKFALLGLLGVSFAVALYRGPRLESQFAELMSGSSAPMGDYVSQAHAMHWWFWPFDPKYV